MIINENMNEYHTISQLVITTAKHKVHGTKLLNQLLTSRLRPVGKPLITSHDISKSDIQKSLQETLCEQSLQTPKAHRPTRVGHVAQTNIGSPILQR